MKSILPLLFLSIFITGCTISNTNQQQTMKKNDLFVAEKKLKKIKKLKKEIPKKVTPNVFLVEEEKQQEHVYSNLNDTIIDIADQLFDTKVNKKNKTRVILTSFVDLNSFNKTTTFGRLLSESMFNELHIRKFSVTDFRGQNAVLVNEDGEFHITRNTEKLKDKVYAVEYILVGTYAKFENESLLINARILDSQSGKILSTARVAYQPKDCTLFGICNTPENNYALPQNLLDNLNINLREQFQKVKSNNTNSNSNSQQQISKKQIIDTNSRKESSFSIIQDDCKDVECKK